MTHHEPATSTMTTEEARSLLEVVVVARVAFLHEGRVELLPVNVVLHDGMLVLRTAPDSVLAALVERHDVVLEADHLETLDQAGWSVVVRGVSAEVRDPEVVARLRAAGRPWPWAQGERDVFLSVSIDEVTGRRVRRPH